MKKILFLLVLLPIVVVAQTQTENYITNKTYKVETATSITTPTITQANQNITYFDGLGRPIQQVAHQQSGSGKDIVTPIEYDGFGRQTKDYLPYVPNATASLDYKASALTDVLNFPHYSGQNPYSEKLLESSPLNRVLKQAAPGTDWALGSGHEIKLDYQTNTTADAVKLFAVNANWNGTKGLYDTPTSLTPDDYLQFQLYKNITKDENWVSGNNNTTEEFKNKEGQVVLKRTYDAGVKHDTYYIYDQYGNLTFVIPPLADATVTISNTILDGLCYQYKYDSRNRLVEKKLPGKQWEFIVYDKLDRPVATGPAFSPFGDGSIGWLITKYDVFSRVVYTGWQAATVTSSTRLSLQNNQNNFTTANYETKSSSGTIDSITAYYTNTVAPTSFKLLTVNYYDDYNFPNAPSPVPTSVLSDGSQAVYYNNTQKPIGLPTGSWVRVLQTQADNNGESSYTLYDKKARPVRSYTKNYLSPAGYTYTDTKIDFSGKVLVSETYHKRQSTDTELKTTEVFTYSPQDRLLTHTHQINNQAAQLLAENTYDELGQLTSKNVGNTTTTPLQKVDYAYNIRGWLTGMNNDPTNNLVLNTSEKDLFSFKINYNSIAGNVPGVKPLYNGNISETYWRTASDNVLRKYGYEYDKLNRLTNATYQKPGNVNPVTNSYNEKLSYDKNGNIQTLLRNGGLDSESFCYKIDHLIYIYNPTSPNQLLNVYDESGNTPGFIALNDDSGIYDGATYYGYDLNGNLITDVTKGISNISYNHLNLPTKITFTPVESIYYAFGNVPGNITYIYNALGQKLEKIITQGTTITSTNYLGGYQYTKPNAGVWGLDFFPTAEGYFKQTAGSPLGLGAYVFNYTDHLGNVRLSYAKNATTNVLEILEESNYYPFGLKHKGYNSNNAQPDYKYKYNGKEYQDELGLNMYDYGARNYDPAIGRFMNVDPLAEKYPGVSPYVYCLGNPVNLIDPDGMEAVPPRTIFVNGYLMMGELKGGRDYWNKSFRDGAIGYLTKGFKEMQETYVNYNPSLYESASSRFDSGYEYAKEHYSDLTQNMSRTEDSFNFVTHSMGTAYGEGMSKYLQEMGWKIDTEVHINAFQAADITAQTTWSFKDPTKVIDYQNTDDPVINNPIRSSPGDIKGATSKIRENSGVKDIEYIHASPIGKGKEFWKELDKKAEE